jgi:hypothetical protein
MQETTRTVAKSKSNILYFLLYNTDSSINWLGWSVAAIVLFSIVEVGC